MVLTLTSFARSATVVVAALSISILLGPPAWAEGAIPGSVGGRVEIGIPGVRLAAQGPLVLVLEPVDPIAPPTVPPAPARISQRGASFIPSFLVVTAGQAVETPNDDTIFHNVFSYSRPNEFDLGMYGQGESRTVTLEHPGLVRVYCSIHESMNASIYVAPTPYYDQADAAGRFLISDVPPGRYTLRTWNQRLPDATRQIEVRSDEVTDLTVVVGTSDTSGGRR